MKNRTSLGNEEMAQWITVLALLSHNPGLVPSIQALKLQAVQGVPLATVG